jgi:hypothetical protein
MGIQTRFASQFWRTGLLVDRASAQLHFGPNPQNLNGYDYLAFRALVVLNLRQISPDHPVAIIADMRSSAAFPFAVQRDAEIGTVLQFPQEVLDLAVDLAILGLDPIQVLARDRT